MFTAQPRNLVPVSTVAKGPGPRLYQPRVLVPVSISQGSWSLVSFIRPRVLVPVSINQGSSSLWSLSTKGPGPCLYQKPRVLPSLSLSNQGLWSLSALPGIRLLDGNFKNNRQRKDRKEGAWDYDRAPSTSEEPVGPFHRGLASLTAL